MVPLLDSRKSKVCVWLGESWSLGSPRCYLYLTNKPSSPPLPVALQLW